MKKRIVKVIRNCFCMFLVCQLGCGAPKTNDSSTDNKRTDMASANFVDSRWKNEDEFLALAPATKLTEQTFELESIDFKMQLPENAKISSRIDELFIEFPSGVACRFNFGVYDWSKLCNEHYSELFNTATHHVIGQDLMMSEVSGDKWGNTEGWLLDLNLLVGGFDMTVSVDHYDREDNRAISPTEASLTFKCLRTVESVEPMPSVEDSAEWFEAVGAKVKTDENSRIVELNLRAVPNGPTIMAQVSKLKQLQKLAINIDHVSGESIAVLAECPELKILSLYKSYGVNEVILDQISRIETLEEFQVSLKSVTANGIKSISQLSSLKKLSLNIKNDDAKALSGLLNTNIDFLYLDKTSEWRGDELAFLSKMKNLSRLIVAGIINDEQVLSIEKNDQILELDFRELAVSDKSIEHLSGFTQLTSLNLTGRVTKPLPSVTEEGMLKLASLAKIKDLKVGNLPFNDQTLKQISKYSSIGSLEFYNTKLTEAAVNEFEKEHPDIYIRARY